MKKIKTKENVIKSKKMELKDAEVKTSDTGEGPDPKKEEK